MLSSPATPQIFTQQTILINALYFFSYNAEVALKREKRRHKKKLVIEKTTRQRSPKPSTSKDYESPASESSPSSSEEMDEDCVENMGPKEKPPSLLWTLFPQ